MGFTVGAGRAVFWVRGASSSGFSKVGPTVGVLGAEFGSMGRAFPADSGVGSTEEASLGMPAPAFCGSKQDSDDSTVGSGVGSVDWACGARAQPKVCRVVMVEFTSMVISPLRVEIYVAVTSSEQPSISCVSQQPIISAHRLLPYRF